MPDRRGAGLCNHLRAKRQGGSDALSSLRKGGVVAINAIHLDQMPAFEYDKLLWGERQIRSVANMTRVDARDFLALAHKLNIQPRVLSFLWIRPTRHWTL